MKNTSVVVALLAGLVLGYVIRGITMDSEPEGNGAAQAAVQAEAGALPPALQVGDAHVKGPADAKVTIVEWSDFECPFCGRVNPTLTQIEQTYGKDVRIAFKHQPLPFHKNAQLAAEAAEAAGAQGKFWEMHDKLFANQKALTRPDLEKYAEELGLDMAKFKAALDQGTYKAKVQAHAQAGQAVGARGTPTFFINGERLVGAQPFPAFKQAIESQLKKADALLKQGTSRKDLYAVAAAASYQAPEAPKPQQPEARPERPTFAKVQVGDAHVKGPADAKVTIVEWSDFECPFCSRVNPTLAQIEKDYPGQVRVAFKHQPLPFHKNAQLAAEAAEAAGAQGKFWEMHDKLFANQKAMTRADLEKYAEELGLDQAKFKAALDQGTYKAKVQAHAAEGSKVGARGTPTFFINGRLIAGAQPLPAFKAIIDEEIKKADALAKAGTPSKDLYARLLADNEKTYGSAAPARPAAAPAAADARTEVSLGSAPVRGAKDAPVTIVAFSDFECPFCSRVVPTMEQLLKEYDGKVKLAFRHQPLGFHKHAQLAAEASMAAAEQGKFWEMHDKLFANQKALTRGDLEKYAQELGLDVAKFKSALDSGRFTPVVRADAADAAKVGANGTPTFFINGRKVVGAQPIDSFRQVIDQELNGKKN